MGFTTVSAVFMYKTGMDADAKSVVFTVSPRLNTLEKKITDAKNAIRRTGIRSKTFFIYAKTSAISFENIVNALLSGVCTKVMGFPVTG